MAPSASKFQRLPFNCYEVGHTWNSSCSLATADLGFSAFKESIKIYLSCYVLSLLASRRYPKSKESILKVIKEILRSSTFLTVNAVGFVTLFCILRRILGYFNFYTIGFVPALLASYLAILVEKEKRRSLLALYVTNVASETLFRMLRSRGIVRNIKYFDVLIFCSSTTTLLYQMKKDGRGTDFVNTIFKKILGSEEFVRKEGGIEERISGGIELDRSEARMAQREANNVGPGLVIGGPEDAPVLQAEPGGPPKQPDESYKARFIHFVLWMHRQVEDIACHLERMVAAVYEGQAHDTCPHRKPCFKYWMQGFWTRFAAGFGIQAVIQIFMVVRFLISGNHGNILRNPPSNSIFFTTSLKSGLGLSAICLAFRLLSCSFRWLLGNEDPQHAIASGVMASALCFVLIRPPPSLGLYLFFKAAEVVISELHRENNLRIIRWMDSAYGGGWCLLYAVSTALLFHAGMLEPQNLKPSYYQFLARLTGRKMYDINRHLMTVYGTSSNLLMKNIWPSVDPQYISEQMRQLLKNKNNFSQGQELTKELVMQFVY